MHQIPIGIFGLGTIGTGVMRVLEQNGALIQRRLGAKIVVRKIVDLDVTTDRGIAVPPGVLSTRADDILKDPEVQIVVELIGGTGASREVVGQALTAGKHVVTANKALLAEHGEELYALAHKHQRRIAFEASVGGGIPIVQAIREGLAANRIESIYGIVNGTANYILTQMTEAGAPFEAVLKEAIAHGYAEADPSYDVEGIDSAHKLAVLASLAFGTPVALDQVYTEGISQITPVDIDYARSFGYKIKLLGITKLVNGEVEARVHPTMISEKSLLAQVDGVLNAIYVNGDAVGPSLYYGKGAGALPTASAVISDLIDISRDILHGVVGRVPPAAYLQASRELIPVRNMDAVRCRYFLRFATVDEPGVLSRIAGVLAQHQISIASVIQKGRGADGPVPIVMITHWAEERNVKHALLETDRLEITRDKTVLIRIEDWRGEDEQS